MNFIYRFGPQRSVPGFVTFRTGSFFSGDRKEISYSGRIELSPKFSLEPRLGFNFVDLPEGDFTTRLVSTRVTYTVSPRMFVSGLFQYNSSSDSASSNVRFRWEYEPGSDLFLVYSDGYFMRNRELLADLARLAYEIVIGFEADGWCYGTVGVSMSRV